jgi:two-component system OmpR family sensor kinase
MLSLRGRLLLGHLGAILAIVACAALAGWWQLSRSIHGQLDAALLALAETEVGMLVGNGGGPVRVHDTLAGNVPSLTRLDRLVQIIDVTGGVLARSSNLASGALPVSPSLRARLANGDTVFDTLPHAGEEPLRMVSVPAVIDGRTLAVQVAGSLDDVDHTLQAAGLLFSTMAVALLLAVGGAGLLLTRGLLHAIDVIVDQARLIGDASLHARLPHPGTDDEIGHLVDTLNAMLARLESAFDVQRRFTADASHELRTPLSRLRMEIEVTLRRPRDPQAYIDTLRSCMDEVLRLTALVEELLTLARIDAGADRGGAAPVAALDLARDAVDRLAPAARARDVALVLDTQGAPAGAVVHAALGLVLTNLLDNALKFSPPGTRVTVTVAGTVGALEFAVRDQGQGITPEDLPHVFDRFYRGAGARAGTAGVGLGLALSQAIMHAVGGSIGAGNAAGGGALFTVRTAPAALR